jgi:flavin-dependent dehydrogenase
MGSSPSKTRYDAVIAGARCAGASTAMLLARRGLRVLVVDPVPRGRDTLSTHALMRGAVLQLHRWGLLDAVRASGATPIRSTTFHYGAEKIEVPIKPRDGVDALFGPRRTVLDPILEDAAREAGAEVAHGQALVDLLRDADGRVRGARIEGPDRQPLDVTADLVIGADGIRSRVARILGLEPYYQASHTSCAIYAYWEGVPLEGNHWFFEPGVSIGTIPTNDGAACVFASIPQRRFAERGKTGLEALHLEALRAVHPDLADLVAATPPVGKMRAFAGTPGFLRPATGPGWALVGDAGYFRDPITAHGISDALREAELLALAIAGDGSAGVGTDAEAALAAYGPARDARVRGLLDTTDRIASFEWDLDEVKGLHLELNKEMNAQVDVLRALDGALAT